ncbi:MAG: protein kinase [Proteobacteria bacterium]|nr:protein kinase [Pseudomonadota bacterium]
MGDPATDQQIIAGVVLGERLAVTMYGGIHRAQHAGQRNLRGLVIDPRMLAEDGFRRALTDQQGIRSTLALDHPHIVSAVAVESEGPEVVVVTRGTGRYVTAQDLISTARSGKQKKLSPEIAGAIGKAVVEALATAHAAGVVHGAVHPRSVLIDEQGDVRLSDFVVGRALTTAVAQGADSSLWRGLAGYIAPELVVGEDPTPRVDIYAVGALFFTMLTGEVQPGATLHTTPAMERLVMRALDTDVSRRYDSAKALLENLVEALEDDHWQLADKAALVRAAGLQQAGDGLDDATEDLLASLGSSAVQVMPTRPSMDIRAEAVAARHQKSPQQTTGGRLEALLADLDEPSSVTIVDEVSSRRDPVGDLIDARGGRRVPSLDDPDEDEPASPSVAPGLPPRVPRSTTTDESAALDALADLDESSSRVPAPRAGAAVSAPIAVRIASAATTAPRDATDTVPETRIDATRAATPASRRAMAPIVDPIRDDELPSVKLRSPVARIVGGLLLLGIVVGGGYLVLTNFTKQDERAEADKKRQDDLLAANEKAAAEARKKYDAAQVDAGSVVISSIPAQAGVWLRIGRTPCTTMMLTGATSHEFALLADEREVTHVQVLAQHWASEPKKGATITATLVPAKPDPKTKRLPPLELPVQPPAEHLAQTGAALASSGPIKLESSPTDAEVWMFVGITGTMKFDSLTAGREYELVVSKPGFKPKRVSIKADDWRDNDPNNPIDLAKKLSKIERTVELEPKAK